VRLRGSFNCRNPHDIGRRILRRNQAQFIECLRCRNPHDIGRRILQYLHRQGCGLQESQSSWHWKANITHDQGDMYSEFKVAILMTLEGEYYRTLWWKNFTRAMSQSSWHWKANITRRVTERNDNNSSRNPHDIGRRILPKVYRDGRGFAIGRNPHDIGRRILHTQMNAEGVFNLLVAILMTLEGEYYWLPCLCVRKGRGVAILMTLEGEYYQMSFCLT